MPEDLSLTQTIYPSLMDRTVFISGGAAGIGSSMVVHFCAQKSKVAFVDINVEAANILVEAIAAQGHPAPTFIECDLRDVNKLQATVKQVGRDLGNITVLINSAANDERHDIAEVTLEYWEDRLAVNMRHIFFATQTAAPQMIEAGEGSIISFGSISWMSAQDDLPAYAASKASVHGLTRGFARYYGKHGIRANTLVPGWIFTERQKELWYNKEGEQVLQIRQCIKDHIQPYEVARMALFLGADDSKMCTAQNFIVDAGWT